MFNWSCTNSNRPPFPAWILILDYILPFAAVPEDGRKIDRLNNKSKLAHCIMLFNLLCTLAAQEARRTLRAGPDTWLAAWHCHWVSKCCWSRSKSDSGVFQIVWTRSTRVLPIQSPKNSRHMAFTHSPLAFILGLTLTHPLFFKQHHPSVPSCYYLRQCSWFQGYQWYWGQACPSVGQLSTLSRVQTSSSISLHLNPPPHSSN